MSSRLVALTARRAALQAECALQRDDAAQTYAVIESGTMRIDRLVGALRRLAPVLVVGAGAALIVLGPARAVTLVRRGLTFALYVLQARSLLR